LEKGPLKFLVRLGAHFKDIWWGGVPNLSPDLKGKGNLFSFGAPLFLFFGPNFNLRRGAGIFYPGEVG